MSTPSAKPLATTNVQTALGTVCVPCEAFGEWLGVTPTVGHDEQGNAILTGSFTVTHLSSGWTFSMGSGCMSCARAAAQELSSMDLDWAGLTLESAPTWGADADEKTKADVAMWRNLDWLCSAVDCDRDDDGLDPEYTAALVDVPLPDEKP